MMALYVYLLLTSFLATGYSSWILTSTHSSVIPGLTDNVTLHCLHESLGVARLSTLTRIRLLKVVDKQWHMYAQISPPNTSQPVLDNPNQPDVAVSSRLGQANEAFLKVTWSIASGDTVGIYKCEIDGFDSSNGTNVETFTGITSITNRPVTVKNLLNIIVQMKKGADNPHPSQAQVLENRIMNKVASAIEDNYFEVRYWPTGVYGLLTDAYGCPNAPFSNFSAGFASFQTLASSRLPPQFNYSQCLNCDSQQEIRFNFCTNNRTEPRLLWPHGSYCIQAATTACPKGFSYGFTNLYLKTGESLIFKRRNAGYSISPDTRNKLIQWRYCCRSDGNTTTPILLPNAKGFYLYRYRGICQTVHSMDVTNVSIQIGTDDKKPGRFYNAYHADGTINGRIELCYYTKKMTTQ